MIPLARQASALGLKGSLFLGGDGWDASELLEKAGAELEGALFMNHWAIDAPSPENTAFVGSYRARYGRDPTGLAAMGHDAAAVLANALARSRDESPGAVRDALAETRDFVGASGAISFPSGGEPAKDVVVIRIHNRRFTYHASVRPAPPR
jgi:branched-chain amino acid transport system substrate-binding protein